MADLEHVVDLKCCVDMGIEDQKSTSHSEGLPIVSLSQRRETQGGSVEKERRDYLEYLLLLE